MAKENEHSSPETTATKIWFDEELMYVQLSDERILEVPFKTYKRLAKGTKEQLDKYELWKNGTWIHWEKLDEDLSVDGLVRDLSDKGKL